MHVTLNYGSHFDEVIVDGERLDPVPSLELFNHSPDGFSWGYSGSGPAQLALALLLEAGVDDDVAVRLHQDFKEEFVATWPQRSFEVDVDPFTWALEKVTP